MNLNLFRKRNIEARNSIEDPRVPISSSTILSFFGLEESSSSGGLVTTESALGVPAIWAAVNFLSGTLAGLPLHVYKRVGDSRERQSGTIDRLLNDVANDEMTAFDFRKHLFDQVFTEGRGLAFIERNKAGSPINLWPLDVSKTVVNRKNGRKVYVYTEDGKKHTYNASEVIDVPFMLKGDGVKHRPPIKQMKEAIGLAQNVETYGGRFFANGGVPPFAIEGPFKSPSGAQRASEDLEKAVAKAAREKRQALALPLGHTIKSIGADPKSTQYVEMQRFCVEQVARIYSLPLTFLQDLTHGTFSNTEQQDLHFVKHTLKRWVEQFEKELNLKVFGRNANARYFEFNLDGMLRGDFPTRMEGYAKGIQTAIFTPNEARRRENLPDDPAGDSLMVQGATVPISNAFEVQDGET